MKNLSIKNFITAVFDVILTLDTGGAYVAGQVLCDTANLALPRLPDDNDALRGEIVSLQVLDEDAQGQPMDIVFLRANQSLGTKRAAISITDAQARDIIGLVPVSAFTDYVANKQAYASFDPIPFELAAANLFVSGITRGTPTYTANGVRLRLGIRFFNIDQW